MKVHIDLDSSSTTTYPEYKFEVKTRGEDGHWLPLETEYSIGGGGACCVSFDLPPGCDIVAMVIPKNFVRREK